MRDDAKLRRPGGRNAEVTQAIFAATTHLLVRGGFKAVTFQQVAKAAGVGRATLYRRWPTPADLVADAIHASAAEQIVVADLGSLREDLRHVLGKISDFIASPIGRAALTAGLFSTPDPSDATAETRWTARWFDVSRMFERAADRGELPAEVDAELVFSKSAGAIYFRRIVMNLPADADWVDRIVDDLPITANASTRKSQI
jgi:AcrR family transcriptional regulator